MKPNTTKPMRAIRVYDNGGKTNDRYTAVFITPEFSGNQKYYMYVALNGNPTSPAYGFYQHGELKELPPVKNWESVGRRIPFAKLPEVCQGLLIGELQ